MKTDRNTQKHINKPLFIILASVLILASAACIGMDWYIFAILLFIFSIIFLRKALHPHQYEWFWLIISWPIIGVLIILTADEMAKPYPDNGNIGLFFLLIFFITTCSLIALIISIVKFIKLHKWINILTGFLAMAPFLIYFIYLIFSQNI